MSDDLELTIAFGVFVAIFVVVIAVKVMLRQQRKKYMRGWAERRGGRYQPDATEGLRERIAPAVPFTKRGTRALDAVPEAVPDFICRPRHAEEEARQQISSVAGALGLRSGELDRGYARADVGDRDFAQRWVVASPEPDALAATWCPELTSAIDAQPGARLEVQGATAIVLPEHSDVYYDEPLDAQVAAVAALARALAGD